MLTVALYARVSSERQAQTNTIASQIAALEHRINFDGYQIAEELKFIDNGYSGTNLIRPALERLRNETAAGRLDKIYIHSPDRLARRYAHQMVLLEEFQKAGVEIIFLNYQPNESPESHLLVQMQGMIAEYERAKSMERYRRGKIYAAKKGSVNVFSRAPYGYRYIDKTLGGGQAAYEICEETAEVVRKIFSWMGLERCSIREVCRRLKKLDIPSPKGKTKWDSGVIFRMISNPAYKGQAAFGKTRVGPMLTRVRPQKRSCEQPKANYSLYPVEKENWIYIPVPPIVDENLFEAVQEQLQENKKLARVRRKGASYLLQGLVVCQSCHYAYYGKHTPTDGKSYKYYACTGADAHRFDGNKVCHNKQIRAESLEMGIWEEVKYLLKNPQRILKEYQRRIAELEQSPTEQVYETIEKQKVKLQGSIARLIDSYTQEYIDKEEFEPRIKALKHRLKVLEEQQAKVIDIKELKKGLSVVVANVEHFADRIKLVLDQVDWQTQRDIIRSLIKHIEINQEDVNIVFRIENLPGPTKGNSEDLQHCCPSRCLDFKSSSIQ